MALRLFTGRVGGVALSDEFYFHQAKVLENEQLVINIIPVVNATKAGLIDMCRSMTMFGSTNIENSVFGDALYGESAREGIEYVEYLNYATRANIRGVSNSRLAGFTAVVEFSDVTTEQTIIETGNDYSNGSLYSLIVKNGYLSVYIFGFSDYSMAWSSNMSMIIGETDIAVSVGIQYTITWNTTNLTVSHFDANGDKVSVIYNYALARDYLSIGGSDANCSPQYLGKFYSLVGYDSNSSIQWRNMWLLNSVIKYQIYHHLLGHEA